MSNEQVLKLLQFTLPNDSFQVHFLQNVKGRQVLAPLILEKCSQHPTPLLSCGSQGSANEGILESIYTLLFSNDATVRKLIVPLSRLNELATKIKDTGITDLVMNL